VKKTKNTELIDVEAMGNIGWEWPMKANSLGESGHCPEPMSLEPVIPVWW